MKIIRSIAIRIFTVLAEAEAQVHGVAPEAVHFHEVGAVDSIADIAAAAICLDNLGVEKVIVPRLYEGSGFVRCQHGVIPVFVPAVLQILQKYGIKLQITETEGELDTPTGAAIVAAILNMVHRNIAQQKLRLMTTIFGERPSLLSAPAADVSEDIDKWLNEKK